MGRFTNFLGSGKTYDAASPTSTNYASQVVTFTGNDLPSAGVVAYHFGMTADTFNIVNRIRVKADNRLIYDVGPAHFRKWAERFSSVGYTMPTDLLRFSIPFNLFDIVDDDLADVCQFPRGTVPTVELTLQCRGGSTPASITGGKIYAGWTQTDAQPVFYPTLIGQQMNIAASATNATFPISERGAIRGMIVDTTGLGRFKCELNGFQYVHAFSAAYLGATCGDGLLESQSLEDGAGKNGGVTIATQAGFRIPMVVASQGSSRVELDTYGGWAAGASSGGGNVQAANATANELTVWAVSNQN